MDYDKLMKAARKTNRKRDAIDRQAGFAPVSAVAIIDQLRTVQEAIKAGIVTNDWSCVAEAQDMLETAIKQMEGKRN